MEPVSILLYCPECHERHVDEGQWATKPHHTHACQYCGFVWRPAVVDTVGVRYLPGFRELTPVECEAYRQVDEMYCPRCNLRWDANDPEPPQCNPL